MCIRGCTIQQPEHAQRKHVYIACLPTCRSVAGAHTFLALYVSQSVSVANACYTLACKCNALRWLNNVIYVKTLLVLERTILLAVWAANLANLGRRCALFIWAGLAYNPWLKVLLIGLV